MNLGLVVAVVCSAFLLVYCMVLQSNAKALADKLERVVARIDRVDYDCHEHIDAMQTEVMALQEQVKVLKTKPQPKPKKPKQ